MFNRQVAEKPVPARRAFKVSPSCRPMSEGDGEHVDSRPTRAAESALYFSPFLTGYLSSARFAGSMRGGISLISSHACLPK
jgi:hypothetical protein